jgi:hypothetical protein
MGKKRLLGGAVLNIYLFKKLEKVRERTGSGLRITKRYCRTLHSTTEHPSYAACFTIPEPLVI